MSMSHVTTHVLDTGSGRPAADVPVTLHRLDGGRWVQIAEGATDAAVLYADTAESTYDTSIFLANATGAAITATCNDDASCPSGVAGGFTALNQSRCAKGVHAGTY